jgi:hypothetical protein
MQIFGLSAFPSPRAPRLGERRGVVIARQVRLRISSLLSSVADWHCTTRSRQWARSGGL